MKKGNWPHRTWKELWKFEDNYVNVNSRERERERDRKRKKKQLSEQKGIGEKDRQKAVAKDRQWKIVRNIKSRSLQHFISQKLHRKVYFKNFILKTLY